MTNKNAKLGLLVAAALSLYLVFRLVQATAPTPISIQLLNLGPAPVTITALSVSGENVLHERIALQPTSAGASAAEGSSRALSLAIGRPTKIRVQMGTSDPAATCSMEPRPQGRCVIRADLRANADLQCRYECATIP